MALLNLEIISPDRIAYTDTADRIVVPSVTGQLTILPHHIKLFTQLIEGEVKIVKGSDEYFLAIGGGFLEVATEKTTVLVTRAVHAQELNEQEIHEAIESAEKIIRDQPSSLDIQAAEQLMRSMLIDLKVLERRKTRRAKPIGSIDQ